MLLAALIDLGANFEKIKNKLELASKLVPDVKNFEISCKKVLKNGINASQIQFSFEETIHHRHGKDLQSIMNRITTELDWNDKEKEIALKILNTLITAEAKIHGTSIEHVHLHEAGSVDTIMDILGFVLACQDLGILNNCLWISTPIAVGGGLLQFSHGITSIPAPATIEILKIKNFEIIGGPVESELATPTGVSILTNMVEQQLKFYPSLIIKSIGYGAGIKDFPNIPNVLRIILGILPVESPYNFEQIVTIETNIDDVSGELLGNCINKVIETGHAKDISVIPITSKKRPGYIIQVLTTYAHINPIVHLLITELGTLGVRFFPTMRYIVNRKIISFPIQLLNQTYNISVKISWDSMNMIIQTKPESDEVLHLSEKTGVPLRQILQLVNTELAKKYPLGQKLNHLPNS